MIPAIGILIGGKSRRMGTPKALIPIGGSTLLERTVETARSITHDLLLLGQPLFDLPPSLKSLPIVPDHHPHVGPLGGLESLLISRPNAGGILLACDMPFLTAELLKRLIEPPVLVKFDVEQPPSAAFLASNRTSTEPADGEGDREGSPNDAAVCSTPTDPAWHPCAALYKPACLPTVQAAIDAGRYGMIDLLNRLRVRRVELTGEEMRWVENWNEPQDVR